MISNLRLTMTSLIKTLVSLWWWSVQDRILSEKTISSSFSVLITQSNWVLCMIINWRLTEIFSRKITWSRTSRNDCWRCECDENVMFICDWRFCFALSYVKRADFVHEYIANLLQFADVVCYKYAKCNVFIFMILLFIVHVMNVNYCTEFAR